MGGKIRFLIEKYDMDVKNVIECWNDNISEYEELVSVWEQVNEIKGMRDRCIYTIRYCNVLG